MVGFGGCQEGGARPWVRAPPMEGHAPVAGAPRAGAPKNAPRSYPALQGCLVGRLGVGRVSPTGLQRRPYT